MSFSYEPGSRDMATAESIKAELGPFCLSDRNSDFEFSICHSFDYESSSADELFANGMILPVQIQQRNNTAAPNGTSKHEGEALPSSLPPPIPCPPSDESKKKASIKEIAVPRLDSEEKPVPKSFWGFRRSSSLNSEGVQKKSLICSFPLLSRSNSTGSAPNPKKAPQKQPSITWPKSLSSSSSSSSTSSSSSNNVNSRPQKPPLKKNSHGTYAHRVRVSPVLNVPTPSISKGTASFLGLGSFLGNGKDKKIRR